VREDHETLGDLSGGVTAQDQPASPDVDEALRAVGSS